MEASAWKQTIIIQIYYPFSADPTFAEAAAEQTGVGGEKGRGGEKRGGGGGGGGEEKKCGECLKQVAEVGRSPSFSTVQSGSILSNTNTPRNPQ